MPTNNHALIRYRTIDRCLKSGGTYHLKDLMSACSEAINEYEEMVNPKDFKEKKISRRTLFMDLKFMKDEIAGFGAPIEADRTDGYYYSDSQFEIFKAKISKSDLDELSDILLTLKKLSGKSQFKNLESAIARIEETYNIKRSRNKKPIIQFEHSSNIEGQKWITELKEMVKRKQTVNFRYQPFDKKAAHRIISPYLIKEYNNRWFLIGYDHDHNRMTNLGMDRILGMEISLQDYILDDNFDADNYLKDIVGVTIHDNSKIEKIVFKAYGFTRHFIDKKPLHPSQTVKMKKDHAVFTISVFINYEVKSKLRSFGKYVEILKPKSLREEFKKEVELIAEFYD